jgi:hypothetical protein
LKKKIRLVEVTAMMDKNRSDKKITRRVRLFLSFDPLRTVEGTLTIPSSIARLSDVVNDERPFFSVEDAVASDGWLPPLSEFVLLNKREVKAIVELK